MVSAGVDTRTAILEAARARLLAVGYAGLSTRKVAQEAGVPLSQLHYHFGSKSRLILELLATENRQRLERQHRMYAQAQTSGTWVKIAVEVGPGAQAVLIL